MGGKALVQHRKRKKLRYAAQSSVPALTALVESCARDRLPVSARFICEFRLGKASQGTINLLPTHNTAAFAAGMSHLIGVHHSKFEPCLQARGTR